jgi:hypothetical protein
MTHLSVIEFVASDDSAGVRRLTPADQNGEGAGGKCHKTFFFFVANGVTNKLECLSLTSFEASLMLVIMISRGRLKQYS